MRRELKRERLRQRTAPRHPERIDRAVVSELAEKLVREAGKAGKTIRQQRGRRAARAGNVECNDLALRQRRHERLDQFQAAAAPAEDEERGETRGARPRAEWQALGLYGESSNSHRAGP